MRVPGQRGLIMTGKNRRADLALAAIAVGVLVAVGFHNQLRVVGYWIFLAVVAAAVIGLIALAKKGANGRG